MYLLYTALLAFSLLLSSPYWLLQMLRARKYRAGLRERLGRVARRLSADARKTIWVHAVSVGEVQATTGLITALQQSHPECRVVVSTTTDTGQKLARQRFGEENVFYFPLDFAFAIRPYLRCLQPILVVIAETELWPNFLHLARESGAQIAVVNARLSDRSRRGYQLFRGIMRRILANVTFFSAQTEEDKKRLVEIGVPEDHIQVSGNLKYDVTASSATPIVTSLRSAFDSCGIRPVVVAGSTMEGEESLLLRAFEIVRGTYARAVMIIAPRHPQRFQQVFDLVASLGLPVWRRSLWSGEDLAGGVLVLDTIGELASVYSLGDLAFVGGSLVEFGGHNILEPVQYGVATLIGPHYENFRDMVNSFHAAEAVRIVGPAELPLMLLELLSNPGERRAIGERGLERLRSEAGATKRTLSMLQQLLADRVSHAAL